jgi:hypothetical protein
MSPPPRYVTGGSETMYIQTDFLINATLKWGKFFQAIYSDQDKGIIHAFEQLTKNK